MEFTLLLAKVFGVYMLLACALLTFRERRVMSVLGSFMSESYARFVTSIFGLLLGLFLINLHTVWSSVAASVVTLISWAVVVKSIAILAMPEKNLEKLITMFNHKMWIRVDAIFAGVIGVFLTLIGYGVIWF